MIKQKTVVVALSGGVDSAVSALLLQQQGYKVIGAFMKCWDGDEQGCTAQEDEYWARRVAAHLNIPFYRFNLVEEYKKRVVDYFLQEYQATRTPNPDVMCNSQIKFGVFFDTVIKALSPEYVATGHYARTQTTNKTTHILKGIDPTKDQSYFLYRIEPNVLHKVLFPVGELEKKQVRRIAHQHNLPNADKKDSQGICFIGNIKVREFLQERLKVEQGNVVTQDGKVVGTHSGLAFYTIGQRKGVGSFGGGVPYYVLAKNREQNELVVGGRYDENITTHTVHIEDTRWFDTPLENNEYCASIRYRQKAEPVKVERINKTQYTLTFQQPQRAATQGQSAVVYNDQVLVGGGIIV